MNQKLNKNGIGLLGATTLGVVMLSPAMTLYGGFGPTFLNAGSAAPLAYIWALLATLPTACSYIILSKAFPTSGSAADWAEKAFHRQIAVWAGWMVFLYYLTNFIIQPVTMGVFAGDLFKLIDVAPGFLSFSLGALICLGLSARFVYKGISVSTHGALAFLLIETLIVAALCITVLVTASHSGMSLNFEGVSLSAAPNGASGVFRAMVFSILAFCGFDVVSTLAEETRDPEKNIPRATFLSLFVYAAMIILGVWALSFSASRDELIKITEAGQMPISEVARRAWGFGGILIPITGVSAALGLAIATGVGASRVLFSMSRGGLAPARFSLLSVTQAPANSLHVIFGAGLVSSLATALYLGPYDSYVWWGTTATFFAMLTYGIVNTANMILHRHRWTESVLSFALFFLIPLIGIFTDLYLLYRTFFVELWAQNWSTGKSVVVFDLVCCLLALWVAFSNRKKTASLA